MCGNVRRIYLAHVAGCFKHGADLILFLVPQGERNLLTSRATNCSRELSSMALVNRPRLRPLSPLLSRTLRITSLIQCCEGNANEDAADQQMPRHTS